MYQYGIVEDINDPLKLGRVKVRVYGAHTLTNGSGKYNIETKDLGWSQVVMPANTPAIGGLGHSVNLIARTFYKDGDLLPEVFIDRFGHEQYEVSTETVPAIGDEKSTGSLVCGIFLDSGQQEFLVTGTLPTKSHGEDDNNDRVKGIAGIESLDPKGVHEPASGYAPIYPNNNVYATESGHVKEYDDTPGAERIKERHKSGTQYEIQPDGTKVEKIVRDNYTLIVGNDTLEVNGNVKIYVAGDANVAVTQNLTAQVGKDMTTVVHGNAYTTVDGNADLLVKGDIDGEVRGSILFDVGEGKPEHVIHKDGLEVHHHDLDGYTKHQAITQWFPPVMTDTFTLTYRNMRTVKEMSTEEQAPYASALASFADYDASKVALVDGMWTYPNKTSYVAEYGVIELHTEGKLKAVIGGETDITALQSAKVTALDNITITATGDESIIGMNTIGASSKININAAGTSSQIDVNSAGTLKLFSTGTTDIESTGDMTLKSADITLDGDVAITGNVVTTGTTHTSTSQQLDGHNHAITSGSSAGNTGNLS